ncbi:MAG: DNA internalization-related competence protein ComEC/Rec2, partial [Clostridiales bacterium]|nr:DNA internalization-related competence protein ComEC/Rec2 [Clostridiales bacterium]
MVLFYIVGIVSGRYIESFSSLAIFTLLVLALCYAASNHFNKKISALIFIFFLLGLALTRNTLFNKNKYLESTLGIDAQITGIVLESQPQPYGGHKIILKAFETIHNGNKYMGKYKISADIQYGAATSEILTIYGKLEALALPSNLGSYNEQIYLLSDRIRYKIRASSTESRGVSHDFNYCLSKIRSKAISIYSQTLPESESAIMQSMVLGFDENLSDETSELYKTSGIYHILAISGLHILILSNIIASALGLFLSKKKAAIITLALLALYCVFTGASPSTLRAVIMFSIIAFGNLIYREPDLLTSLALSAFIILLHSPLYLFKIGFQLSFSAVLGIGLFNEPVKRILFKTLKIKNDYLSETLSTMLSVNLIVSYASMFYFYRFNPYFMFANFIVLPTASFILAVGVLALAIGFININIAIFFSGAIYYLLKLYEAICALISNLPLSSILVGRPGIIASIIYFLVLVMIYLFEKKKKFVIIYTFVFIILAIPISLLMPKHTKVAILDVSQGDSFVINKGKKTFIIDCGNRPNNLLNYLDFNGINTIEAVFLSHTDSDHSGAIPQLAQNKKIKNIFMPKRGYEGDEVHAFLSENIGLYNYKLNYLTSGNSVSFEGLNFQCVSPKEENIQDANEGSMAIKFTHGKNSFLFTGDMGFESEQLLLHDNIESDVLKISHHGSATSSSSEFLEKVNPKLCVI